MEGIDKAIEKIQNVLNNDVWQDDSLNVVHYGKTYRQNAAYGDNDQVVAMYFDDVTKDYLQVMFDDSKDVLSFIDLDDEITGIADGQPLRTGRLIVAINLKRVYPQQTGKAQEAAYQEIIRAIKNELSFVFEIDGIEANEAAYGVLFSDNIKRFNTYPYHVFAVTGAIKYYYNNC